jgi:hypothetical protein
MRQLLCEFAANSTLGSAAQSQTWSFAAKRQLLSPRKTRFFAEQKMRPNEVLKKLPVSIITLQGEAL